MTDNTTTWAGNYPGLNNTKITCILSEGAPTVGTSYDQAGLSQTTLTWASELYEGDWVALANDAVITFARTEGSPVVEKAVNAETLVIGKIVSLPKTNRFPATTGVADSLTKQLDNGYYRTAVVEIFGGATKVAKAVVMADGSNATVPGVGATLKFNMTSSYANHKLYFDTESSGGVGVIPCHYCAAGSNGDLTDCLVLITGPMLAATGA
jgi:hypothetical protein